MPVTDEAFVTLCTNDIYCQGALVLGKSLRRHETSRQLIVMITSQVSSRMRIILGKVFDDVLEVDLLDSEDSVRLLLLKRPELGVTFTKIQCWTLTRYTKCVYMDADTIALRNIDELFDREEFSAAPDSGWPDCFNSGVFVFRPSIDTFKHLLQYAGDHGSFDGGDQGLLNGFFSNWATADISKHLPFIYNLSISSVYTYIPAFKQFGSEAKVVHFIGTPKPWNCRYNPQTKCIVEEESLTGSQHLLFLVHWWEIYISDILPLLTEQEELDCTNKHQFGRIELQMKCEHLSPDCSKEAHADRPDNTIWKNSIQETLPVASESSETSIVPSDLGNDDGFDMADVEKNAEQPSSSSEQHAADDSLQGQDPLPSQLSPQPVIEEDSVHMPQLSKSVSELAIQEAEEALKAEEERRKWEEGQIDYMGKHSFDNIQKKLDQFLQ